jgi:hypothetical protein
MDRHFECFSSWLKMKILWIALEIIKLIGRGERVVSNK